MSRDQRSGRLQESLPLIGHERPTVPAALRPLTFHSLGLQPPGSLRASLAGQPPSSDPGNTPGGRPGQSNPPPRPHGIERVRKVTSRERGPLSSPWTRIEKNLTAGSPDRVDRKSSLPATEKNRGIDLSSAAANAIPCRGTSRSLELPHSSSPGLGNSEQRALEGILRMHRSRELASPFNSTFKHNRAHSARGSSRRDPATVREGIRGQVSA